MKILATITFILITTISLWAQDQPIRVMGTVMDEASHQPLEYATVKVLNATTDELITGTTTGPDGTFSLETLASGVYLEVGYMGYVATILNNFKVVDGQVNLGDIALQEDASTLDEVVVRGEKSQTEFKLDKRVFNVGQDLSSTGVSALEVLNNVPSVNVNIEGEIRLRGAGGVQVMINGKPSVLTSEQGNALGTLTSDMIESVEVITNPSAKYNAEGTSGIINIVLKKEEKRGLNGSVTLNTGVPNNHSLGFSVNNRTEKFNLFSQVGAGIRTMPVIFETVNQSLADSSSILSQGEGAKTEKFFNLTLGTDYHMNEFNVISLTGNLAYEWEDETSDAFFQSLNANNANVSEWNREEATTAVNPKYQYEMQYKKDFADNEKHTLLFSALGSYFGKDQSSEFNNQLLSGEQNFSTEQQTHTDFKEGEYTFKLDYTQPFTDAITIETGAQYVMTDVTNNYQISYRDEAQQWVVQDDLSNVFDYNQKVLGLYGTGAYEGEQFGLKLGLRLETTDLHTQLLNTEQQNQQNYYNFFPSVHSSYKVLENFSLQAGYSRRVSRPRLFDLNPYYNIQNNYAIRTGNPLLQPEFTDSYEVTGIFNQGEFSLNTAVYYRYTTEVVEEVSTYQDNVSISMPMNVGTNGATGIELNTKYTAVSWWSVSGDFNFNYFHRQGSYEDTSFDFNTRQWSGRMTNKFNLPADFDLEVMTSYQSGYQTFQQQISGYLFADMGVRKKIVKGKAIVNLSVRDIFASRIQESVTSQPSFYLYNYRRRGRFITLGISYGFGKGEAMEFSGQKRHF